MVRNVTPNGASRFGPQCPGGDVVKNRMNTGFAASAMAQ
jgi:hypothetical protein